MKLKRITASVGMALALGLAATAAQAATQAVSPTIGSSGYLWSNVLLPDSGTFSDTFNFSLAPGSTNASSVFQTTIWGGASNQVTFTLMSGAGSEVSGWTIVGLPQTPSANVAASTYTASANYTSLSTSTSYHLLVSGASAENLGSLNGSGAYVYSLQIAAVPEPETYAMFSVGLLLLGALGKRAKKEAI